MNYCGHCGAAITNMKPEAAAPAAPVDWPLPQVDEARAPLSIEQGIEQGIDQDIDQDIAQDIAQEPTIPSLVGPGSLIMPPSAAHATEQPIAPFAPTDEPQAAPQAIPQATPEFTSELAALVAA